MTGGQTLTIGKLAALADSNVPTIRYYEEIGLLSPAIRTAGGQRTYGDADRRRLAERNCAEAGDVARGHLDTMRKNLKELQALERSLVVFVQSCDAECVGGPAANCTIMDDLQSQDAQRRHCCG